MDIEQIKNMLTSPDAQSRRLAFGLIFNNLETIPSETLLTYKALYFDHMIIESNVNTTVLAKMEKKGISVNDVINDMTFVVENLNRNEEDLNKVFMFSPKSIIEKVIKQEAKC